MRKKYQAKGDEFEMVEREYQKLQDKHREVL